MKTPNSFFVIGSIGMIATAIVHIIVAAVNPEPIEHSAFISIYAVFVTFLILGAAQLKKIKNH